MKSILLVFVAFAAMISFMVYRCMMTPVDLVTKEYYKEELVYQQVIDGKKQAATLSGRITLQQEPGTVTLQLPAEMKKAAVKGSILFYCGSNADKDRNFLLLPDSAGRQTFDARSFLPGHYTVKIEWECKGIHYFAEEPFVLITATAAIPGA